jgi:hypothetical protein
MKELAVGNGVRALVLGLICAGAMVSGATADTGSRDIAGVWWARTSTPHLVPMNGEPLPFTPAGQARYASNIAGLKSGAMTDEAVHLCVPEGMPRALTSAYPFQIILTPGQVTFAHEANRAYRQVAFTDKHADPKTWDPSYMGQGIANLDGDGLVIDTANLKADRIYLDSTGEPASEKLHLIEHIRLLDGGKRLEDVVTIADPVIFTKPWSARLVFQRRDDVRLKTDWVCGERHRDVSAHMARTGQ